MHPMKHFTQDEYAPRLQTLQLIRQFAYTYRVIKMADGSCIPCCLN